MAEEGETKKEGGRHGDKPQQEANDTQQVHTLEFVCVCVHAQRRERLREQASEREGKGRKGGRVTRRLGEPPPSSPPPSLSLSLWSRRVAASDSA